MIVEFAMVSAMYVADISTAADYINPITIVVKGGEKLIDHIDKSSKKKEQLLPKETIEKFKSWEKEDWYKDDKNKDMWDPNWIKKS